MKKVKVKTISLDAIKGHVAEMEQDVEKFNGGNSAAGTRIRKAAMEIKKQCGEIRKQVSDIKNSRK